MSITARLDPLHLDLRAIIDEEFSPEAQSRQLADFAREALSDAQETNRKAIGRVPPHETTVDRRRGAPIDSVKPDGVVFFEFELLEDLFGWIGEQLVLHAPVLTGQYARSFIFMADGIEVEPGAPAPQADEYVFLNVQPYSRKIERGQSPQAPDGVFQAVADLARRRFSNVASIKFSYRALQGREIMAYQAVERTTGRDRRGRFTSSGADRSAQRVEQSLRQPAIVIRVR